MRPPLFGQWHGSMYGLRGAITNKESKERFVQHTEHMKELADEMASWVPDADRQLERFVASLDREVIVDCPVDNATTDEFEHWLRLSLL